MSSWALLAIAGAALWATSNVLDKIILSKWIKDPRINILALGVVSMVVGAGALLTGSATFGPTTLFVLNLAAGTIYVGAAWVYYRAVIIEEISRVVPLFYISPVIVGLLSAVFFHEQLGSYAYLGVLLLVAGAILVVCRPPGNGFGPCVVLLHGTQVHRRGNCRSVLPGES